MIGLITAWTAASGCWLDSTGLQPATGGGGSVLVGGAGGTGEGGSTGIPCRTLEDCPGDDSDCGYRTCYDSVCGFQLVPRDTVCTGLDETRHVCDGEGRCVKTDGQTCAEHDSCLSGFCIDGVCCDARCDGECESCDLAATIGRCVPHQARTDPGNECTGLGVCDGSSGCAYGDHLWSHGYGDTDDDRAHDVAVDTDGSVVVVGQFEAGIDFGGAPLTSRGATDVFVVKLSAAGVRQWARTFGALGGSDDDAAYGVALDSQGNVVVAGSFEGSIDFSSPTPTTEQLTSAGTSDAFVVKLTSGGDYIWSKRFGGNQVEVVHAVRVDSNDAIVIAGEFESSTLDVGGVLLTNAHTGSTNDLFVAKLDSLGTTSWAAAYGDMADQCILSTPCANLAIDSSDSVVFAGGVFGTVDFGGGLLVDAGGSDAVVVKLSPTGGHLFSQRFGDATDQHVSDVAIGPSGGVVITGAYEGTVNFGTGSLPFGTESSAYLAQFDNQGTALSSRSFDGLRERVGSALGVDDRGNVVLIGSFGGAMGGTIDVDAGSMWSTSDGSDLFVVKYAAQGAHLWSHQFGDSYDERGSALALDSSGNVVIVGYYQGNLSFGGPALPYHHTVDHDVFVAKLKP